MLTNPNDALAPRGGASAAISPEPARELSQGLGQELSQELGQELSQLREQVDAIDDQIMELVSKRIELASQIMKAKPASQIVDSDRELEIVRRYFERLAALTTFPKAKRLVLGIIQASKLYPES